MSIMIGPSEVETYLRAFNRDATASWLSCNFPGELPLTSRVTYVRGPFMVYDEEARESLDIF